ncbi:MAG: hypothetical protein Q4B63_10680 [Clostridium perfringens]|nr:hypothetical protein [Clostridium perfringens]
MFCSIKRNKKNKRYSFYLCDRQREKESGKIKCSDKYIMSLQEEEIINLTNDKIRKRIESACINKGISLFNIDFIINKYDELKNSVVISDNVPLQEEELKNNVVIENNISLQTDNVKIVKAEIIENVEPDYKTLIMFDVKQEYLSNIKQALKLSNFSKAMYGEQKNIFEIEKEELERIYNKRDEIEKRIQSILSEKSEVDSINYKFEELNSDLRIVQDIYIRCYDKMPRSELWLVGGGYIKQIYNDMHIIIFPYEGSILYENWNEIKSEFKLSDGNLYINEDEEFREIDLYRSSTLEIDKKDITGTIIRVMFNNNCDVDYSMSDFIDIKFNESDLSLNIEHFIDWINNKPTFNYKVDIEGLKQFREQLYKYNEL